MTDTLVNRCLAMSRRIKDSRMVHEVSYKLGEEFGELSQELLIAAGKHYKKPGKDGVIGEALDMIVCLIDLIYCHQHDVTEEQLAEMIQRKLDKWAEKAEQMLPGCTVVRDGFFDELEFVEVGDNKAVFNRSDGSLEFMEMQEFNSCMFHIEKRILKGRFEYNENGTIVMKLVVFGDINEARKEYENDMGTINR